MEFLRTTGDFRTLLGEGVLLAEFRLYPAAIRHFEDAVRANPASDEARYNLANAQFQNHEEAQALESLQQASPEAQKDDSYLALEVLERYSQIFPHGSIDVDRIRQTLDAAPVSGNSGKTVGLSPDARREFYQLALTLAEQDR